MRDEAMAMGAEDSQFKVRKALSTTVSAEGGTNHGAGSVDAGFATARER